jgi:hypothetical protein
LETRITSGLKRIWRDGEASGVELRECDGAEEEVSGVMILAV